MKKRQYVYQRKIPLMEHLQLTPEDGIDGFKFTSSNRFKMRWEGSNTIDIPAYRNTVDVFNSLQLRSCMSQIVTEEGRMLVNKTKTTKKE
jgi:hypothetical protein